MKLSRHILLKYIEGRPYGVTPKEIAAEFGLDPIDAATRLRLLYKRKILRRINKGNTFSYTLDTEWIPASGVLPTVDDDSVETREALREYRVTPMTRKDFKEFLDKWSKVKWDPKIFRSASNLPMAIGKYYRMAVRQLNGEIIYQEDVDEIRDILNEFRGDLANTLLVVDSILAVSELRSAREFGLFLIGKTDPMNYVAQVERLEFHNDLLTELLDSSEDS
jgi:hypothetical protein